MKRIMVKINMVIWIFIMLGLGAVVGAEFTLINNGQSQCVVVLGKDATAIEKHAADELRTYLKKIAGAEVAVVENIGQGTKTYPVYLGTPGDCPKLEEMGLISDVKTLSDEGFLIKADMGGMIIAGKKPMGVLYGVYTFLEEQLGVRWFHPGAQGEYCPKLATIAIGAIHEKQNPVFVVRKMILTSCNIDGRMIDSWDWLVRNKMQINQYSWAKYEQELTERGLICEAGGHTLNYLVPPEQYFTNHPEYYPLINGKRTAYIYKEREKGVYQLCTSNPEVIEIAAAKVIATFKKTREGGFYKPADVFVLGNNDGNGWCECDKCRAQDDPEEQKRGMVSTRFYKFINAVTERALKECPDKKMIGWGYQLFQEPPRGVKPDLRLSIYMAMHGRCYQHSYDDPNCPANADKLKLLKGWLAFGNVVGWHEYYSCFLGHTYPYVPLEGIAARDVKHLAGLGATFWRCEVPPVDGVFPKRFDTPFARENWMSHFATYYIVAKLLWSPGGNVEELMDDLYRKYYGPAAGAMKSYRALLAKTWETAEGHVIYGTPGSVIGKCLTVPGREQELLRCLDLAEKAAGGDKETLEKVARERKYFSEVWQKAAEDWAKLKNVEEVKIGKCEGQIVIDGELNEADWGKAKVVTGFKKENGEMAKVQTFVKMLNDNENVYFGIECMEPTPDKLEAKCAGRDEVVWRDDDLEIFIDPEGTGTNYYHFAINPKGAIYDARCAPGSFDVKFNADCEVACKVKPGRWIVELRVKGASLNGKIADGRIWKVDVGRCRRVGGPEEGSTWNDGNFHQPASFRPVVFGGGDALIQNGGFENVAELKSPAGGAWKFGNDPALVPAYWALHGKAGKVTIVTDEKHSGRNAWKIEKGCVYHREIPAAKDETLHIEFWGKGAGELTIMLFQYSRTPENPQKFIGTDEIAKLVLTPEWKRYELDFKVNREKADMACLAFAAGEWLIMDDVTVRKIK